MGLGDVLGKQKGPTSSTSKGSRSLAVEGSRAAPVSTQKSPQESPRSPFSKKGKIRSLLRLSSHNPTSSVEDSTDKSASESLQTSPLVRSSSKTMDRRHSSDSSMRKGKSQSDVGNSTASYPSEDEAETPRSRKNSVTSFIKRKLLNKNDVDSSDYDSDRSSRSSNSRRRWRKARSTPSIEKPRSASRDSSPGRLRSYLDQYRGTDKDQQQQRTKKKGSRKESSRSHDGYIQDDDSGSNANDNPIPARDAAKIPPSSGHDVSDADGEALQGSVSSSRIPSSRSSIVGKSRSDSNRRKNQTDQAYFSDEGDEDETKATKTRPRRRSSQTKRKSDSQEGEMALKGLNNSPPDASEEMSRPKPVESPSYMKKKKGASARSMGSTESKKSVESDASKGRAKGRKSGKKSGSSIRSMDRSIASSDSKSIKSERSQSVLPNLPEQEAASPGDLMDAPVPPRRKLGTFKEEKEKMERELLFNKLEVVRLQEQLTEAQEKLEENSESQRKDRVEFEKATAELKRLKGGGSGGDTSRLQDEIRQLKKTIAAKDSRIDALNDEVQEQICKVEHLEEELASAEDDMNNLRDDMQNLEMEVAAKQQEEDAWLTDDDDSNGGEKSGKARELDSRQKELEAWEKKLENQERELKREEARRSSSRDEDEAGAQRQAGLDPSRGDDNDGDGSVELSQVAKSESIPGLPDSMTQMAMEVMQKEMAEMRSWVVKSARELDADRALYGDDGLEKLKQLTKENDGLRTKLHEKETAVQDKESLVDSFRKELETLEDLLREEKGKRRDDAEYWEDVEREINQQLQEVSEEKKSLEFKLERALRRADTTETKLDTARFEIQDQLSTIAELQKQVSKAKYAPQKETSNSKLESELERMQYKNDLLREKLYKLEEMQVSNGNTSHSRDSRSGPSAEEKKLQRELERMQTKNDALRERLDKYESQPVSNNDSAGRIRSLENQLSRLKIDLDDRESTNASLLTRQKQLKNELSDAHSKRERESERLQDTIEELIMNRDELEEELEANRKERDKEVIRLNYDIEGLRADNKKLADKLHSADKVKSGFANGQEEAIAKMHDSFGRLKNENDKLRKEVQKVGGEQSRQVVLVEEREAEIASLRSALENLEGEKAALEQKVHKKGEGANTNETLKAQGAEIEALRASLRALKEENAALEAKAREVGGDAAARKTVKVQEAEIERLQNQLKQTFEQFEKRHPQEYPALLQELKIRKGEVDTVRKSMYEVQERNKRLETELQQMSQKLEFDLNGDASESAHGDNSMRSLTFGGASSKELEDLKVELENWKATATSWQSKAEACVKESLEWKKRAEEWEQEAAQWETVATESQAANALGTDSQAMTYAAMDVTTRLQPHMDGDDDEERIRGLTRQNAALNERIAVIQNELRVLCVNGEDDEASDRRGGKNP